MKQTNMSEHEKNIVKVIRAIVSDQTIEVKDSEGDIFRSEAKTIDDGAITITKCFKNNKLFLRIIYDHDCSDEQEFWMEDE